jgi:hypothetical protein
LRCGSYNHDSFDKTIELLRPIILEAEDQGYKENIDAINAMQSGVILGCDCQHCRSQRTVGPAPYATATFICHNQGSNYGKILFQSSISKHQMQESGLTGRESKDKITVDLGLKKLISKLNKIERGLCDGSSSTNKSWKDIVQTSDKYSNPPLSNCFWHKAKSLPAKFNREMAEKKILLPKSKQKGNKKYGLKYPDLQEFGIVGKKIKNHFYRCQALYAGNSTEMTLEFRNLVVFYQELLENSISEQTANDLELWLTKNSTDFDKYCHGLKTDLEESFHRVALKYWKKGSTYSYEEYVTRRALAFLD